MWEDESDPFDEMDRRVHAILRQTMAGMHTSLFDMDSKSLKPLYRIEVSDERVTVTFDLPYVRKEDISLTSTEETLSIEAKMKKPVTMKLGGSIHRGESARRPGQRTAGEHMQVDVKHALAGFAVRIEHGPIAAVVITVLLGKRRREPDHRANQWIVILRQIVERSDVLSRDNEQVKGCLGVDVLERDELLVLIHDRASDLARNDLAEKAVGHRR